MHDLMIYISYMLMERFHAAQQSGLLPSIPEDLA